MLGTIGRDANRIHRHGGSLSKALGPDLIAGAADDDPSGIAPYSQAGADVDPMRDLFWSVVINGVIAVPIMIVMMLLTQRPEVMGPFHLSHRLLALGGLRTAVMPMGALAMLATSIS